MNFCFLLVWRCQYSNKIQDPNIYKSKCKQIQRKYNICLGDIFNNGRGIVIENNFQSTKNEKDIQVLLHPYIICVRVLNELFSITCRSMKFHLIWLFTTQSCVIIYLHFKWVWYHTFPFLYRQKKGFFVARRVSIILGNILYIVPLPVLFTRSFCRENRKTYQLVVKGHVRSCFCYIGYLCKR